MGTIEVAQKSAKDEEVKKERAKHTERTDQSYRGMPLEFEGFDNFIYKRSVDFGELMYRRGEAEAVAMGKLPLDEPGMFAANHPGISSTFFLPWGVRTAVNRPLQIIAKDTLLDPGKKEEASVLDTTGKTGDVMEGVPGIVDNVFNHAFGAVARGGNCISISREGRSPETARIVRMVFERGGLVGTFPQGTRTEEDDISNIKPGLEFLMRMSPNINIYPVMMKNARMKRKEPDLSPIIGIGEPFTFRDVIPERKASSDKEREGREFTLFLAERMHDVWQRISPETELKMPEGLTSQDTHKTIVDLGKHS